MGRSDCAAQFFLPVVVLFVQTKIHHDDHHRHHQINCRRQPCRAEIRRPRLLAVALGSALFLRSSVVRCLCVSVCVCERPAGQITRMINDYESYLFGGRPCLLCAGFRLGLRRPRWRCPLSVCCLAATPARAPYVPTGVGCKSRAPALLKNLSQGWPLASRAAVLKKNAPPPTLASGQAAQTEVARLMNWLGLNLGAPERQQTLAWPPLPPPQPTPSPPMTTTLNRRHVWISLGSLLLPFSLPSSMGARRGRQLNRVNIGPPLGPSASVTQLEMFKMEPRNVCHWLELN